MPEIELRAGRASVLLTTRAGMLLDAALEQADGIVHPFARATWTADPSRGRPVHIDVLGGEFVAVPFGSAGRPSGLAAGWEPVPADPIEPPHGFAADADWRIERRSDRAVVLVCDYPSDDPIRYLRRQVVLRDDGTGIDFTLQIEVRRPVNLPVGIHPIFRLPTRQFSVRIDAGFGMGHTYPGVVPPNAGVAMPGRRFEDLAAVPSGDSTTDLSRLPLERPMEDVLLLTDVSGPIRLLDDAGSGVQLEWDRQTLPSALLWISDRALGGDPWHHRYRGLGIEPVAAAFDLHPEVSSRANPLTAAGVPTSLSLSPARATVIRSSITTVFRESIHMT